VITIKNLKFQPLTFNLSGGDTLHLGPREQKTISNKDLSKELTLAKERGLITISENKKTKRRRRK